MTVRQRIAARALRRRLRAAARDVPRVGVGMPAWLKLNAYGALVTDAFPGAQPYLVGSAARGKEWRDVDVRVMLDPEQWERFLGGESYGTANAYPHGSRRAALELAFAALGREWTGLPIDFQLMPVAFGNRPKHDGPRVALGVDVHRHRPAGRDGL